MEVEPVRRAASAQFNVSSDVGSAAALREAMDPASRSLADALQMSFRVLQFVTWQEPLVFHVTGSTGWPLSWSTWIPPIRWWNEFGKVELILNPSPVGG